MFSLICTLCSVFSLCSVFDKVCLLFCQPFLSWLCKFFLTISSSIFLQCHIEWGFPEWILNDTMCASLCQRVCIWKWMRPALWEQLVRVSVSVCACSTFSSNKHNRLHAIHFSCRISSRVCLKSLMGTCSSLSADLDWTSWHVVARSVASNSSLHTNSRRTSDYSQRAFVVADNWWPPLTKVCIQEDSQCVRCRPNRKAARAACGCAGMGACARAQRAHALDAHTECTQKPFWIVLGGGRSREGHSGTLSGFTPKARA